MSTSRRLACFALFVGLVVGIFYAVNRVGDLNGQASALEACVNALYNESDTTGCPDRPIGDYEVETLRDTAGTIGTLGWLCFWILFFGGARTLYGAITAPPESDKGKQLPAGTDDPKDFDDTRRSERVDRG